MGTFIGHYGCSDIPEEKREEFKERVLKIMDQGGIMYRDDIHIYGKELNLLIPYRATDSGYLMVISIILKTTVGKPQTFCLKMLSFVLAKWVATSLTP